MLAASGRRVKQAKLARFPSLSLTASGGTSTESIRDVLKSDFGIWSIGGRLTQPIFQGGEISGGIKIEQAAERETIALLQKTVLNAFGEVEQALVAETYLVQRVRVAKQASELASEAAQSAREEYSAGIGDVLTLIEATERDVDSASQYVALQRLRLENRVDLHLALGGDFRASK